MPKVEVKISFYNKLIIKFNPPFRKVIAVHTLSVPQLARCDILYINTGKFIRAQGKQTNAQPSRRKSRGSDRKILLKTRHAVRRTSEPHSTIRCIAASIGTFVLEHIEVEKRRVMTRGAMYRCQHLSRGKRAEGMCKSRASERVRAHNVEIGKSR